MAYGPTVNVNEVSRHSLLAAGVQMQNFIIIYLQITARQLNDKYNEIHKHKKAIYRSQTFQTMTGPREAGNF